MSEVTSTCKIAAGIVLFNPEDNTRFQQSIRSVLNQVSKVYIFDNSTTTLTLKLPDNVVYRTEHSNKGIAYALNQIMMLAKNDGFEWVVTMDQDSILPERIITVYESVVDTVDKLAIICPQVIDTRRAYMEVKKEPVAEYVKECITSASCTSIKAWEEVGKYDEWLFIDLVDNEFCKRIVVSGYKILRLNTLVLNQEFGKIIPKSPNKQKFWIKLSKLLHNENIAKFSYKKFVNPMRVYYTNRNIIYVNRKMKNYGSTGYENYNCKGYIGFLISFSLPSLLRAQKKWQVLTAIIHGIKDGHKVKVGIWHASINTSRMVIKNKCVFSGIVTFNPNIDRLVDNLKAIAFQVREVVIFDNGSSNQESVVQLVSLFNNVNIIKSNNNLGIASALNKLMEYGELQGYEWMLTLDQDSVCTDDYVDSMEKYLNIESNIGIVAPVIEDRNVGIVGHNPLNDYSEVRTCITSGAFVKLEVWLQIGGYDEFLFIDSVDFDFCYRVRKFGYKVIQVKNVKLKHEIGNGEQKKFLFWRITLFGHSAFRKYYIARNNVYYPLKNKLYLHFIRGNLRNAKMIVTTLLYESDKKDKIIAIKNGWLDAYKAKNLLQHNSKG